MKTALILVGVVFLVLISMEGPASARRSSGRGSSGRGSSGHGSSGHGSSGHGSSGHGSSGYKDTLGGNIGGAVGSLINGVLPGSSGRGSSGASNNLGGQIGGAVGGLLKGLGRRKRDISNNVAGYEGAETL